jgi:DNA-binding FrmR family transcriptional regulator
MDDDIKRKALARLRRIEGQVAGLGRMLGEDSSCVDVLLQISAAQGALGGVGQLILGQHIESCVSETFLHGDAGQRQEKIEELLDVFSRYGRMGGR